MSLRFVRNTVYFEECCIVDEALDLAEFLRRTKAPKIVLSDCTSAHTALIQLLAAARGKKITPPKDAFLARFVMPYLSECAGGQ